MPPEVSHPEFPAGRDVQIARAALARLQADADLSGYFTSGTGILLVEAEDLFELAGYKAPALALVLGGVGEDWSGNAQVATLTAEISLILFTAAGPATSGDLLRARILNRCKNVLCQEFGQLLDENNCPLNLEVAFQRLALSPRRKADNVLVTTLVAAYRATVSRMVYE